MGRKLQKRRITLTNIWRTYPHRYSEKEKFFATERQYIDISKTFFELLSKMIINGFKYEMPDRGGIIRIKKFKCEKRKINWQLTNELYPDNKELPKEERRYVYFTNSHSSNFSARWLWKISSRVKNVTMYRFKTTFTNRRNLAKNIKENNIIGRYHE